MSRSRSTQEDVVAIGPRELLRRLDRLRDRIRDQLDRSVGTEQLQALPWVVLTGEPNSGKSTLFNALLGRTRAVVSEIAGTTRDVLAEPLSIETAQGPAEVMLVDLAGADSGESPLDRKMRAAARAAIERSDLTLHCLPADEAAPGSAEGDRLVVRTKTDLAGATAFGAGLGVSARTGHGLDVLRAAIARRLADRAVSLAADAMALGPRHESALGAAARSLAEATGLVEPCRDQRHLRHPELIAAAMRTGLDDLGQLAGEVTPDEVLGRIFSTFCVGK
jgi:tRNA modification GTPase